MMGIEFVSCRRCGKRVRATANRCHHCHQTVTNDEAREERTRGQPLEDDDKFGTEHGALEYGGYDNYSQTDDLSQNSFDEEKDEDDSLGILAQSEVRVPVVRQRSQSRNRNLQDEELSTRNTWKSTMRYAAWILLIATVLPIVIQLVAIFQSRR